MFSVGRSSKVDTEGQGFLDNSDTVKKVAQAQIYVVSEETLIKNLRIQRVKLRLSTISWLPSIAETPSIFLRLPLMLVKLRA
jgi:hypothetical protein